jgi:hypothetical protein
MQDSLGKGSCEKEFKAVRECMRRALKQVQKK